MLTRASLPPEALLLVLISFVAFRKGAHVPVQCTFRLQYHVLPCM